MRKILAILLLLLLINSAYIAAFAFPTVFYMGNVLIHVVLGVVAAVLLGGFVLRNREFLRQNVIAVACFSVAAILGGYLTYAGAVSQNRWLVLVHSIAAFAGALAL